MIAFNMFKKLKNKNFSRELELYRYFRVGKYNLRNRFNSSLNIVEERNREVENRFKENM